MFQDLKESNDIQYFAFPSSNKVTEVDEHYFNIVKWEGSLLDSETENRDKMTENLEMMTSNHKKMVDNHYKMKHIHDWLTDNPEKLTTIPPHPDLTFSYHKVLMPVTEPE